MKNENFRKTFTRLVYIIFGFIFGVTLSVLAWVDPNQSPPLGGGVLQTDTSGLKIVTTTQITTGNFTVNVGNVGIGTMTPGGKLTVFDNSRYYYVNRKIGGYDYTEDAVGPNYILLHKAYDGTRMDDYRVFGTISAIRGRTGASNRKLTCEVNTSTAYDTTKGSIICKNEGARLVTLRYGGVKYLALEIANRSRLYNLQFTGWAYAPDGELLRLVYDQDVTEVAGFNALDPITIQGKVGIGTTAPGSLLNLQANRPVLTLGSTDADDKGISFEYHNDEEELRIQAGNSNGNTRVSTLMVIERDTGNVSIGTTTPEYKLDVSGNIRASKSLTAGINIETLNGNKTLTPGVDEMYQWLSTGNANRTITLNTTNAKRGDRFVIRNNDVNNSSYYLTIQQGTTILDYIFAQSIREYIFDGTNWVSADSGTGISTDNNVSIGYNSRSYNSGVAVGASARGHQNGTAVGRDTHGYNGGVAIGRGSQGYNYGVAVGNNARGTRYGVSVGFQAGNNLSLSSDLYNVLIGAYAGHKLTTGMGNIILGYQSGYDSTYSPTTGSKNILIGFQAGTPSNDTSNFLNIGNLIFATGVNTATGADISNGNVGIGTVSPTYKLDVAGDVHGTAFPVSSDIRFKTNIEKLENVLYKLENISAYKFDWNELYQKLGRSDGRRHIGVIAQEIEKEFPELVSEWEQDGVKYKAVDYSRLTAVLLQAIKEQQKIIQEQQKEIEELKSKLKNFDYSNH